MTKDQVKQYEELHRLFMNKCNFICGEFSRFDSYYSKFDTFEINGDKVDCYGFSYLGYGEYSESAGEFDLKWLTSSDDEIIEYADQRVKAKEAERLNEKLRQEALQRDKELKMYEELKKKFEKQ